ncbi:MAG TPA: helix-turn-helix domain-containing protein [Ktedonobacterales bacterium]|nr:helix-turn-helix domain-containing protein [Ktedonobacterales bacterium]
MSDQYTTQVEPLAPDARHTEGGAAKPGGESFCGVAAAVAVLGDAWTLLLVRDLADEPRRFTALQASTGISPRVLTDRLHKMMDEGLVTRHIYAEIPPRVEYTLTSKGHDAVAVVAALRAYGERWLRP